MAKAFNSAISDALALSVHSFNREGVALCSSPCL